MANTKTNTTGKRVASKKMTFFEKRMHITLEANEQLQKTATGVNNANSFAYTPLRDIIEVLTPLKIKYSIADMIDIGDLQSTAPKITIFDTENDEQHVFTLPIINVIDTSFQSAVQNVGAYTTYYRRYLYTLAYDLAAKDTIDGGSLPENGVIVPNVPTDIPDLPTPEIKLNEVCDTEQNQPKSTDSPTPSNDGVQESLFGEDLTDLSSLIGAEQETKEEKTNNNEVVFTAGKYAGMTPENVKAFDPNYVEEVIQGKEPVDENTFTICRDLMM